MARPGQDARRAPEAITPAGGAAAPQARTPDFDHRMAMRMIRLGIVNHVLRSRRFYERVVLAVIVLRALRGMGQENRASAMARLAAWNKREIQRLEHKAEQHGRAVKGAGQMVRSRPSKGLERKMPQG
jgi:hypothetical protein